MSRIVKFALAMLAVGVIGTAGTATFTDAFSLKTTDYHSKKMVKSGGVENIEVDVSSTDVTVVPGQSGQIEVTLKGRLSKTIKEKSNYKLSVEEKGDTLKVKVTQKNMYFYVGMGRVDLNLEVKVPEKMYKSLVIETSSGDIELRDLKADKVEAEASSGDIKMKNVSADSVSRSETSSGDITLKDSVSKKFELLASSGDMILNGLKGDVTAETSSGEIDVKGKSASGNIKADTASGDVNVVFEDRPESLSIVFEGSSGDGTVNLAGVDYDKKTDHTIAGRIGEGKYKLQVTTSSGDFELN
ncbi:DUF4097 domain-containing protein [Fictibacillus aquaticus]|uniref:DUF4097 domain-containing protein n=1 Tax=Fictibacillus aquaticus TaxID=2021314 RepID=A0A235F6U6_9BACL|nr:DUF4097 family beta strand repeat-containing protein [Fictibacillus aquaticus]OYD56667.1 hypothetical protein CGZ90_16795 [Fictibacillus aquaticus]